MSKFTRMIGLMVVLVLLLAGCGSIGSALGSVRGEGDMVTEVREVTGFTAVQLAGIGTVIVEPGEEESVRVEAQQNLLPYLETTVEDGTLIISTRENVNLIPTQGIFYYVTAPTLEKLVMSGLGEINAPLVQGDTVTLQVTGGGNIDVKEVRGGKLDALLSGLGDLNVAGGQVQEQNVRLTGGGSYGAADLQSARAKVNLAGLGSATVRASDELDATITGGGSISYHDRPQVTQSVTGLGEIVALDE